MNKTFAAVAAISAALLVGGCSSDSDASSNAETTSAESVTSTVATAETVVPETQDSGLYGIVVPGFAINRTQISEESVIFDLPGMDFEEAEQWMGAHLPVNDAIDGMVPCGAERIDGMYQWIWGGGADEPMLAVRVFDKPTPQVMISGGDDPVGC